MAWIAALDLGQAQDHSALAAIEQVPNPDVLADGRYRHIYYIRGLERYDLGLDYTVLVEKIKAKFESGILHGCALGVDFTGVGRPVVDHLRSVDIQVSIKPILITGGSKATYDAENKSYNVPKKDLVSTVQVLMQRGLLKWHKDLPLMDKLEKELSDFRVKISQAANEQFGTWRDGQHDDLVLAVALACWLGQEHPPTPDDYYRDTGPATAATPSAGTFRTPGDTLGASQLWKDGWFGAEKLWGGR